jgi:hypothetical protein
MDNTESTVKPTDLKPSEQECLEAADPVKGLKLVSPAAEMHIVELYINFI